MSGSFKTVEDHLIKICQSAAAIVDDNQSNKDLIDIQSLVTEELGKKITKEFVKSFLTLIDTLKSIDKSKKILGLMAEESYPKADYNPTETILEDNIVMEWLTGAWLGLYFLGLPFPHPWEEVGQITESQGGIPSPICIRKAIGDMYKMARLMYNEDYINRQDDLTMYVLAENPLILDYTLVQNPDPQEHQSDSGLNYVPPVIQELALKYAYLQLKLYTRSKLPITYLVKQNTIEYLFKEKALNLEESRQWFKSFFTVSNGKQKVYVVDESKVSGMPSCCVLGFKTGFYTAESLVFRQPSGNTPKIPFAGTYLWNPLLNTYRGKLVDITSDLQENLVTYEEKEWIEKIKP
jgi:hypothetical protein